MTGEGFGAALAAEHAAVYGYGVVGAHLDNAGKATARDAEQAHRNRRDAIADRIIAASATRRRPTRGTPCRSR